MNKLETFMEETSIQMSGNSTITYTRLNHKDFTVHLSINNPTLVTKKVIIRLFLALEEETVVGETSWNYNPRDVLELDRFVYMLEGVALEKIIRQSTNTTSTLKSDKTLTVNQLAQAIKSFQKDPNNVPKSTFCGLPHHLYLPRYPPLSLSLLYKFILGQQHRGETFT